MLIVGPGDTTLDLRFDLGQFDPRITLTRASVATHFDSRGNLVVVQANEPRIDYDLKSGFCRGLLIEEARTNLVFPSAVLATQARAVTAVPHTLSFYGTGTVTLSGASTAGPLAGTGEQDRVSLTFTPSAAALTLTVTGDVRLAQLEVGSFPSSYIPTTTVAVTRQTDVAHLHDTSLFNASEGTLYGEGDIPFDVPTTRVLAVVMDTGSNNPTILGQHAGDTGFAQVIAVGVNQGVLQGDAAWATGPHRLAVAYGATSFSAGFAGGLKTSGVISYAPPKLDRVQIGSQAGVIPLCGHIRRLTYFPFRLPDGRLAEMTGPIGRVI